MTTPRRGGNRRTWSPAKRLRVLEARFGKKVYRTPTIVTKRKIRKKLRKRLELVRDLFRKGAAPYLVTRKLVGIKIMQRNTRITTNDVGKRFSIYNGAYYFYFIPTPAAIGYKFGEYAFTKQWKGPYKKKEKKNKQYRRDSKKIQRPNKKLKSPKRSVSLKVIRGRARAKAKAKARAKIRAARAKTHVKKKR